MPGAEVARDHARVLDLREPLLFEAHGVGAHRLRRELRHHSHHRAGIEPPAQERSDRHVAQEPAPDRSPEEVLQPFQGMRFGFMSAVRPEHELPIGLRDPPVFLEPEGVAREELENAPENGPGRRDVGIGQVIVDRGKIDVPHDRGVRQERLHLGGEREVPRTVMVEEGFLPEAVTRGEERLALRVPEREREHTVQLSEAVPSPDPVRDQEGLGVGARPERLTESLQLRLDLRVVVDLAVEDDRQPSVLGRHRLVARGREVEDREPSVSQRRRAQDHDPFVVGTPMTQETGHRRGQGARGSRLGEIDDARDAAHYVRPRGSNSLTFRFVHRTAWLPSSRA